MNYCMCGAQLDWAGRCPRREAEAARALMMSVSVSYVRSRVGKIGPNDLFEISGNNSPDPPDDDDEVHMPEDYTGDYGIDENEESDE